MLEDLSNTLTDNDISRVEQLPKPKPKSKPKQSVPAKAPAPVKRPAPARTPAQRESPGAKKKGSARTPYRRTLHRTAVVAAAAASAKYVTDTFDYNLCVNISGCFVGATDSCAGLHVVLCQAVCFMIEH